MFSDYVCYFDCLVTLVACVGAAGCYVCGLVGIVICRLLFIWLFCFVLRVVVFGGVVWLLVLRVVCWVWVGLIVLIVIVV